MRPERICEGWYRVLIQINLQSHCQVSTVTNVLAACASVIKYCAIMCRFAMMAVFNLHWNKQSDYTVKHFIEKIGA